MKKIAIINLKGGVAKTVTAINMADILADAGYRVLLIDNDKQGNTSKFFRVHGYEKPTLEDVLVNSGYDIHRAIQKTKYKNIDVIPANMNLLNANLKLMMDVTRPQQIILRGCLEDIETEYDYCIIDNAPDINISVINALVAANDVIVPVKIDQFAFDGLETLKGQFEEIQKSFNPHLNFAGCLVTQFAKNKVNKEGAQWLEQGGKYPVFKTLIHRTVKIDESTFAGVPIVKHSKGCRAAIDYKEFVKEYLKK